MEKVIIHGHRKNQHQRLSSILVCLPLRAILHQRLFSIKDPLSSYLSSSIKGYLPSKTIFYKRQFSINGFLPSKEAFHRRPSSILLHQMCSRIVPIMLTTFKTFQQANCHRQVDRPTEKVTFRGTSFQKLIFFDVSFKTYKHQIISCNNKYKMF